MELIMHKIEVREDGVYDVYPEYETRRAGRQDDPNFSPTGVILISTDGHVVVTSTEVLLWQDNIWFPRNGSCGEPSFIPPNPVSINNIGTVLTTTDSTYYWLDSGWRNSLVEDEIAYLKACILHSGDTAFISQLDTCTDWVLLYYQAQGKGYV